MLLLSSMIRESLFKGLLASFLLLLLYILVVTLVSGWEFTWEQFLKYWYFVLALSLGFGTQVSLHFYLRQKTSKKVLAVSGTTSTLAMISCCSHYLANILPILGVVGIVTFVSSYQIELFWIGIIFNLTGIIYMLRKVSRVVI